MEEINRHKIKKLCDAIWNVVAHIGDTIDEGGELDYHELHQWLTDIVVDADSPVRVVK